MKSKMLSRILASVAGVAFVTATLAQESTLKVGDPAPKLQAGKWVQGEPVKEFETGKAYIVEFWATWCGPCRTSIPHLNELHKKFKDKGLIVIGQDAWEQDEDAVAPFVKKMGENMTYRVALDDKSREKEGAMALTWMKAADQSGIPTAFVINKQGRVAWIGHPMTLKEVLLEDVLADRHDLGKAATEYEASQRNKKQMRELSQKLGASLKNQNWDDAEAALAEVEKLVPENQRDRFGTTRFQILLGRKAYPAAYKLANALADANPDNAMIQNQIAWIIVSREGLEQRDLALAEKAAGRANVITKGQNASILDTLARAQFMNGKKQEAVETQQKAVDVAEGRLKEVFEGFLKSYKEGKLPSVEE